MQTTITTEKHQTQKSTKSNGIYPQFLQTYRNDEITINFVLLLEVKEDVRRIYTLYENVGLDVGLDRFCRIFRIRRKHIPKHPKSALNQDRRRSSVGDNAKILVQINGEYFSFGSKYVKWHLYRSPYMSLFDLTIGHSIYDMCSLFI